MSDDKDGRIAGLVVVAVFFAAVGAPAYFIGVKHGVSATQLEAVNQGKAEYYLDANNERQWRWKETK